LSVTHHTEELWRAYLFSHRIVLVRLGEVSQTPRIVATEIEDSTLRCRWAARTPSTWTVMGVLEPAEGDLTPCPVDAILPNDGMTAPDHIGEPKTLGSRARRMRRSERIARGIADLLVRTRGPVIFGHSGNSDSSNLR
jgi:hypothetical protein